MPNADDHIQRLCRSRVVGVGELVPQSLFHHMVLRFSNKNLVYRIEWKMVTCQVFEALTQLYSWLFSTHRTVIRR